MTKSEFYKLRKKAELTQVQAGIVIGKKERQTSKYDNGILDPSYAEIGALMLLAGYGEKKVLNMFKKALATRI